MGILIGDFQLTGLMIIRRSMILSLKMEKSITLFPISVLSLDSIIRPVSPFRSFEFVSETRSPESLAINRDRRRDNRLMQSIATPRGGSFVLRANAPNAPRT